MIVKENLLIHYVAMFQRPRIFSNQAGIYFYGEVLRTTLVRRKSIREVPMTHGNPEELYYRFMIREWLPLKKPILPKESGFVREFTNIFLLENTEFVPELLLRSEEQYCFYIELKRRTGAALDNSEDSQSFELGKIKVIFGEGEINIYQDGQNVGKCTVQEFSRRLSATFRRLQRYASNVDNDKL